MLWSKSMLCHQWDGAVSNAWLFIGMTEMQCSYVAIQEPLNQRTYHADDFVQDPVVVVMAHGIAQFCIGIFEK
jgi:hypothetical protein